MADRPIHYYNNANTVEIQSKWWSDKIKDEDRYQHIWGVVRAIWEKQNYRSLNNLRFARLYHNMEIRGLDAGLYSRVSSDNTFLSNRVTLNVIKSCTDTVTSKIAKSKPRPFFLTENGNWGLQTRARKLTQYMDGWFDITKTYKKTRRAFSDGCVFGTGVIKLFRENNQVQSERIIPEEIIVDDVEGMYGCPRQIHQKKNVFREVIAGIYPKHREKILSAPSALKGEQATTSCADMITVLESWHLPSYKDAEDGRHSISIETCSLLDEGYKKDYFPFVFFRWTEAMLGFFGNGLAEELIGIQLEINKILRKIQQSQHLVSNPQVWLEYNSKVVSAHINNEIGGLKYYVGQPPIFMTPSAMSPEIYQHLESLYRKAYEITGISAMSAKAEKPAGITAAVALETLSDMETERFMTVAQCYEEFHMEIADIVIDLTRDIYEGDENNKPARNLELSAESKQFMKSIKWRDVNLPKDKYITRVFPTGILPSQPTAKFQRVQEFMQAGMLEREDALSLLDFPDLKSVTSRITAARDDVLRLIDLILEDDDYHPPEPYMNLDMAKRLTQGEYNKAKTNNAPEEKLEMLQRFMDDCDDLMERAKIEAQRMQMEMMIAQQQQQAPMPPEPAMVDPAAMAVPEAAPTSELLPVGAPV